MAAEVEHVCRGSPLGYLKYAYGLEDDGKPKNDSITFVLETLPKLAAKYCGAGGTLIDIGSGPVLNQSAILSKYYKSIYMAEYKEAARDMVHKWMKTGDMGFDWGPYFEMIAKIEGDCDVPSLKARLGASLKDILECDIHKPKCGIPTEAQAIQYDALASYGALDVNSNTIDEYRKAVKNALELLKPGGLFIYCDIISTEFPAEQSDDHHHHHHHGDGDHHHHHDDHDGHVHGISLSADEIKSELAKLGLELLEWQEGANEKKQPYNEFLAVFRK